MSDMIKRNDALEIIQSMYPGIPRVPWLRKDWQERYEPYIRAEKAIRGLPSAQPEEDCDTCKHGYFGGACCNNCKVRFPSHYERRTR